MEEVEGGGAGGGSEWRPGPRPAAGSTPSAAMGPPRGHAEARVAPGKKVGDTALISTGSESPLQGRRVSGA